MARSDTAQVGERNRSASETATDRRREAVEEISGELRRVLAEVFALYVKRKNFHWYMAGERAVSGSSSRTDGPYGSPHTRRSQ
jgi:starvation-inducible DNA-binding protein